MNLEAARGEEASVLTGPAAGIEHRPAGGVLGMEERGDPIGFGAEILEAGIDGVLTFLRPEASVSRPEASVSCMRLLGRSPRLNRRPQT
jgi:hypothetical protein